MQRKQKGFTLIELLVVIAIIGLLSTLAVVALTSARAKARDAKRISDVKQMQTALELYFADQGQKYPNGSLVLGTGDSLVLCSGGFKKAGNDTECGASFATFMGKVPRDPSMTGTVDACPPDAAGGKVCDYGYTSADPNTAYSINFYLEGASGELKVGANCATPDGMKVGACP